MQTHDFIFTGRNKVVAKVMFLQASVIQSTGGVVCLSACWDTTPPPRADTPQSREPAPGANTPGTDTSLEHTPGSRHPPPPQEQTPLGSRHPPGADPPPKQAQAYGQWAAGTHPTGMHYCMGIESLLKKQPN